MQNLAADSDLADGVSMGTCAMCHLLHMGRNDKSGLGLRFGREVKNQLGMPTTFYKKCSNFYNAIKETSIFGAIFEI